MVALPAKEPEPSLGDRPPWEESIRRVWPAERSWDDRLEEEYSRFVAQIGGAVKQRRCTTLRGCLTNPEANPLYEEADATLGESSMRADCADLPYLLRAYFSFKKKLPFGYVSAVSGRGADPRYLLFVEPAATRSWDEHLTPAEVLREISRAVHSGMYRMGQDVEGGDFYPVAIQRKALIPGSVFYDPNGHVLVVVEVTADGVVYFIDGHPDQSLTYRRFSDAFVPGSAALPGGFKRFRPLVLVGGGWARTKNQDLLPGLFGGRTQWDPASFVVSGKGVRYQEWVRASLREPGSQKDPDQELSEQLAALCRAILERQDAVSLAQRDGLATKRHPGVLPENIYGASGPWEVYATPARDARLKATVRELSRFLAEQEGHPFRKAPLAIFAEMEAAPSCQVTYENSRGVQVRLLLSDVLDRLFALSFDPYHCPELRWGAPAGSRERGSCPDDPVKMRFYKDEAGLRHVIDRRYDIPTPLLYGPTEPPSDVDPRRWLR